MGFGLLAFAALMVQAPGLCHAQADAGAAPPPVPVSATPVVRADVPEVLRGLGTVQALNTVLLRGQVDGVLQAVPVTEGQTVRKGDVLAVIDPRPYQAILDAAIARKRQDEAQLGAARADLSRYASLAERQVASQQQLESSQAKAAQLVATIAVDDAQIASARLNLMFCSITAPFDGRVGLRMVDPGNFIRSAETTPILPLSQLQPIAVVFTLPQDNLPAVQVALAAGQPPAIAASSDDKTELDAGILLTIDNAVDQSTGSIRMKAVFPNAKSQLWPGQFVNVRLRVGVTQRALTIPSAAVMHGQGVLFAYVVKPDQTVGRQKLTVLRDNGVTAVIADGVTEGQMVVTDGQSRLRDGARVSIVGTAARQAANPAGPGG